MQLQGSLSGIKGRKPSYTGLAGLNSRAFAVSIELNGLVVSYVEVLGINPTRRRIILYTLSARPAPIEAGEYVNGRGDYPIPPPPQSAYCRGVFGWT